MGRNGDAQGKCRLVRSIVSVMPTKADPVQESLWKFNPTTPLHRPAWLWRRISPVSNPFFVGSPVFSHIVNNFKKLLNFLFYGQLVRKFSNTFLRSALSRPPMTNSTITLRNQFVFLSILVASHFENQLLTSYHWGLPHHMIRPGALSCSLKLAVAPSLSRIVTNNGSIRCIYHQKWN